MIIDILTWVAGALLIFIVGYELYPRYFQTVSAGSKQYLPVRVRTTRCKYKFPKGIKRSDTILAYMRECSPLYEIGSGGEMIRFWETGEYLLVDQKMKNGVQKNHFYLWTQDQKCRVSRCTATANGLPPIFDGHETFVSHEIIGEVVGVWDGESRPETFLPNQL